MACGLLPHRVRQRTVTVWSPFRMSSQPVWRLRWSLPRLPVRLWASRGQGTSRRPGAPTSRETRLRTSGSRGEHLAHRVAARGACRHPRGAEASAQAAVHTLMPMNVHSYSAGACQSRRLHTWVTPVRGGPVIDVTTSVEIARPVRRCSRLSPTRPTRHSGRRAFMRFGGSPTARSESERSTSSSERSRGAESPHGTALWPSSLAGMCGSRSRPGGSPAQRPIGPRPVSPRARCSSAGWNFAPEAHCRCWSPFSRDSCKDSRRDEQRLKSLRSTATLGTNVSTGGPTAVRSGAICADMPMNGRT